MSEGDAARFVPRVHRPATHLYERANLDAELELIRARIGIVVARGREGFRDGEETYDVACMVIIRLAALLERPEFAPHLTTITREERSLFSGRLGAFPGSNIMMVRSHEVQWVLDKKFHDLTRNGPSS